MDSALCRIFLLNAKCTQMGSSLVPTLNKTHEDIKKRSTRGKEYMGERENIFLAKDRTKKSNGQSEHDQ